MKFALSRRAIKRAAATVLVAGGLLAGTGAAAHASTTTTYTVYQDTQAHWITASYDGMNVAVANSATYWGAPVIQWYNTGGTEQKWYFDRVYDQNGTFQGYLLRNEHSNLCLGTDGTAGHQLYQWPCNPAISAELFWYGPWSPVSTQVYFYNSGMFLDVSGYSYGAGAAIDLWYDNGGSNQYFWITNVSS
jgi:hypothetical protein